VRVSLLSPAFNEAAFIAEMIDSVVSQSYPDWRLYIVDDGSADATASIARNWSSSDSRIEVVSSGVKLGKVVALNLAYAAAEDGDLFMLVGADDLLPRDSLKLRVNDFLGRSPDQKLVSFSRLVTLSDDPRYSGLVLPRDSSQGNRSGGCMTLSRGLARVVFPIDARLVAEDLWMRFIAEDYADEVLIHPHGTLQYRIHDDNSNPRLRDYRHATEAIHARARAYRVLLDNERLALSEPMRAKLEALWSAELARYSGSPLNILGVRGVDFGTRAAALAESNVVFHRVRQRYWKLFSGWRR
jgi:glycosyltransferase involved in cell wall biosynthesis